MKKSKASPPPSCVRARASAPPPTYGCLTPHEMLDGLQRILRDYLADGINAEKARTGSYIFQTASGVFRSCVLEGKVEELNARLVALEANRQ